MPLSNLRASEIEPAPKQPGQDSALALCIVALAAVAVGVIYVVSKNCKPKYYWMMDPEEQPPRFWVGAHNNKEVQINGWKRIGGPYERIEDAPPVHPNPTNRVSHISDQPVVRVSAQHSDDMVTWTTVHTERVQLDEFLFFPTNTSGFFRLEAGL
jgi:hypothetical protein